MDGMPLFSGIHARAVTMRQRAGAEAAGLTCDIVNQGEQYRRKTSRIMVSSRLCRRPSTRFPTIPKH